MGDRAPIEGWVEVEPGVTLHYYDWPGSGAPLLCIHGLSANGRCWDGVAEHRSGDQRIIAVDLRGRGLSAKPSAGQYGMIRHAVDMAALIEHLGIGPAVVMGHSMGAYIAAILAATRPELVSHLILSDGAVVGEDLPPEVIRAQIQAALGRLSLTFPSTDAYLAYWSKVPYVNVENEYFRRYLLSDIAQQPDGTYGAVASPAAIEEDMLKLASEFDQPSVIPQIKAPTLVCWAPVGLLQPDKPLAPKAAIEQLVAMLGDSRLVTITGANHYSMLMEPEALGIFDRALTQLLA